MVSIVDLVAPSSANPGDTVEVFLGLAVPNPAFVTILGQYDSVVVNPSTPWEWAEPFVTTYLVLRFTMPPQDVLLQVWAYYFDGAQWVQTDFRLVPISLLQLPPSQYGDLAGTFSAKGPGG